MKKVNYAVIGARFGYSHLYGASRSEKANLVCFCDTDTELAETRKKEFGVPYVTDMDEIINNPDIQAVSIALPDQMHKDVTIRALRAGKHVMCEKPMALKLDECKEMIAVAKETGKFLMVGQVCRYTPGFKKAKELIDAGEIGEIFFAESEYAHDYSKMKSSWRFDPKAPRHGMIGGGCHAVDLLRWICGNPKQVFAYSNRKVLKEWPTDDCTIAIMDMPNDIKAKVFCSTGCKRNYTMRTVIYGTEGTIIVDNTNPTLSIFKNSVSNDGVEEYLGKNSKEIEIKIPVELGSHNVDAEVDEFCSCILENTSPKLSGFEGAATVSVCSAIVESAEKNVPITVDYNF